MLFGTCFLTKLNVKRKKKNTNRGLEKKVKKTESGDFVLKNETLTTTTHQARKQADSEETIETVILNCEGYFEQNNNDEYYVNLNKL